MRPISQVAREFGLSRTTLLYYDRLGLVRPSYRTAAGYRLYQEEDEARLAKVCEYRRAGLPLAEIRDLLEPDARARSRTAAVLEKRLHVLNGEIAALRLQQEVVLALLHRLGRKRDRSARSMTKEKWVKLLRSAGLSDETMMQWHVAFEEQAPEAHQDFLESLGIAPEEIRRIRSRSAEARPRHATTAECRCTTASR